MQDARDLYTATLEGVKLAAEYGKINDLTNTDIILIISTVSMVFNALSIIALVVFVLIMMSGLIGCRPWKDILIKKKKNAQTWTEEFRAELTTPLHCKTGEEQPKVIRIPTLMYLVTVQQPPDDMQPQGYADVNWNSVDILELKRFKEQ